MAAPRCETCDHPYARHYVPGQLRGFYAGVRRDQSLPVPSFAVSGVIACRDCRTRNHRLSTMGEPP